MNNQTKFINDMLDTKIKHYEGRMASAKKDIECHKTLSIVQSSANTISECATALEILEYVKLIVEQSESFALIKEDVSPIDPKTAIIDTGATTVDKPVFEDKFGLLNHLEL